MTDVHTWFGLSYSTHAVLPRLLLQSMPEEWQHQFVTLMEQFDAAFEYVDKPEAYKVEAATQHLVNELLPDQLSAIGYTVDERDYDQMPEGLSSKAIAEWEDDHPTHYYDADGNEVDGSSYVYVPAPDPLPHYQRGRARVEPRLPWYRDPATIRSFAIDRYRSVAKEYTDEQGKAPTLHEQTLLLIGYTTGWDDHVSGRMGEEAAASERLLQAIESVEPCCSGCSGSCSRGDGA